MSGSWDNKEGLDMESEPEEKSSDFKGQDAIIDPEQTENIPESIARLDALLAATQDEEKIRAGMGIRLALGMAMELKRGLPLGSETSELVADWLLTYGKDSVDAAVTIARQFLIKPEEMRKTLGRRLGFGE